MKSSSSTEFTASEGRRFAFPVATAFVLLAVVLWWRDRPSLGWAAVSLATALALAGATAPGRLGPVYRAWMGLAHAISRITTPIFMGVVYFVVLTLFGTAMRLFGRTPIVHRPEDGSFWRTTDGEEKDLRRQF